MDHDPQHDEKGFPPEGSDDELLPVDYFPTDNPYQSEETEAVSAEVDPYAQPAAEEAGPYPPPVQSMSDFLEPFEANVPDFEEKPRPVLTGREVFIYVVMIGILSGVAWWVTKELKQLGTLQQAQATVKINPDLLPSQHHTSSGKRPATRPAATPRERGVQGLVGQLVGMLNPKGKPNQADKAASAAGAKHQELMGELERVSSDAPWADRTLVLLSGIGKPMAAEAVRIFDLTRDDYNRLRAEAIKKQKSGGTRGAGSTGVKSGKSQTTRYVLTGVMSSTAVINGRTVRVGDQVDDATVMQIEPTRVVLSVNGNIVTLRL